MKTFRTFQVDSERDPKLFAWLEALPSGARSHEIRQALKAGMAGNDNRMEGRLQKIEAGLERIESLLENYDATRGGQPAPVPSETPKAPPVVVQNLKNLGN